MAVFSYNVAAINLGKCIYYTRAEAFGIVVTDWDALDPRDRHKYVEMAHDTLQDVKPLPTAKPSPDFFSVAVGITRAHGQKIIGRISESEPWGETA